MRYKTEKWILTNENWYPNYPDNKVRVSLLELIPTKNKIETFRVCIWGGGDFGLEKDFTSRLEAEIVFTRIVNLVTQDQLRSWGFINA